MKTFAALMGLVMLAACQATSLRHDAPASAAGAAPHTIAVLETLDAAAVAAVQAHAAQAGAAAITIITREPATEAPAALAAQSGTPVTFITSDDLDAALAEFEPDAQREPREPPRYTRMYYVTVTCLEHDGFAHTAENTSYAFAHAAAMRSFDYHTRKFTPPHAVVIDVMSLEV